MAIPAIPAQGAPWLTYAQGLDDEIRTGRLSDTALRAAFGTVVSVAKFGAKGDGTTDDTAAIQAAIDSINDPVHGAGGIVWLPGRHAISGRITVPDTIALQGSGSALGYSASQIICTAAGAGVTVSGAGGGGIMSGFRINGSGVATNPLLCTGLSADRTFLGVHVVNGAQDNWIVEMCQNYTFVGCGSQGAGRDNLVLDKSTGGHLFTRFEATAAGRHDLLITQANPASDYGTGGYFAPQHIKFDHSIFERGTADASAVQQDYGLNITFADPVIQGGVTAATTPPMVMGSGTTANMTDPIFSGVATQTAAIQIGASAGLFIDGRGSFVGPVAAFDIASGGLLDLRGSVSLGGGTVMYTAATDRNVRVRSVKRGAETLQRQVSTDVVFDVIVDGEAGARMRLTADGVMQFGDGTNFSFGTALFRRGDGHFGTSPGLAVGGPFSANGASPQGKATLGVAATDLASVIALANALRTMAINDGLGQA